MNSSLIKIFFLSVTFSSVLCLYSQEEKQDIYLGTLYNWKSIIPMKESKNINGDYNIVNGNYIYQLSKISQKFYVVKEHNNDSLLIKILDYTTDYPEKERDTSKNDDSLKTLKPTSNFYKYNYYGSKDNFDILSSEKVNSRDYGLKQKYFIVSKKDIEKHSSYRIAHSLNLAVMTFPFKARFNNQKLEDFTGSVNFGTAIGYKLNHRNDNPWNLSILGGFSISNINLDSVSVSNNHNLLSVTNDFTALSLSFGLMVQYNRIQIGVFTGVDHLKRINQSTFDWDYNGKPWYSIGIGYSIFTNEKEKKGKKNEKQN